MIITKTGKPEISIVYLINIAPKKSTYILLWTIRLFNRHCDICKEFRFEILVINRHNV